MSHKIIQYIIVSLALSHSLTAILSKLLNQVNLEEKHSEHLALHT